MKYLLPLLLLLLISCSIENRSEFKATRFSFRMKTDSAWVPFSKWDSTNLDITMYRQRTFLKKHSWIEIGVRDPQIFKVRKKVIDDVDPSGREIIYLYAVNDDKEGCIILFENHISYANMYIHYDSVHLAYRLVMR